MGRKKRSKGVTIFGISFILVSVIFIIMVHHIESGLANYARLLVWLVPAFLGIGILNLSDFVRLIAICISAIFVIWTPVMYFYLRLMHKRAGLKLPVFTVYEIIDVCLIILGICAIYFFTLPRVKQEFKS